MGLVANSMITYNTAARQKMLHYKGADSQHTGLSFPVPPASVLTSTRMLSAAVH